MKKSILFVVLVLLSITAFSSLANPMPARAAAKGQIMFMLDASSSMLAKDGTSTTRIEKAKTALSKALDSVPSDTEVGLRVYGSTVPDTNKTAGCQDTQLVAAPAANNAAKVKTAVANIQAKGWTLMGKSLQEVQKDFTGEGPKTVILLSDGIDTCTPPSACDVAKTLAANGVKIKIDTLGLLVDGNAKAQLSCIASGSGGDYFDINNIDKLQSTLETITKKEVELFQTKGQPVDCSLRMEDAPILTEGILYKDEFTVPQEVYCSFKVKAHQKVTVILKGAEINSKLGPTDYLGAFGFKAKTGESLAFSAGDSANFGFSDSSVANVAYEFDTDKAGLKDGDVVAVRISLTLTGKGTTGTVIPIELSYTTESNTESSGGNSASNSSNKDSKEAISMSPRTIVLLTLGGVLLLVLIGFIIYKLIQKKRGNSQGPTHQPPTISTSTFQAPIVSPTPAQLPSVDKPDATDQIQNR